MQCTFCHNTVEVSGGWSGVMLCPHCHNPIAKVGVPAHYQQYAPASHHRRRFYRLIQKLPWLFVLPVGTGILVLLLAVFTVMTNISAEQQLGRARSLDAQGNYLLAATILAGQNSPVVLPMVRLGISAESANNLIWLTYHGHQIAGERLLHAQMYQEALAELQRIRSNYPTFVVVTQDVNQAKAGIAAAAQAKQAVAAGQTPQTAQVQQPKNVIPAVPLNCFPPSSISGMRITNTAAFSAVLHSSSIAQTQQTLQSFFDQYGVHVEITSVTPSSYAQAFATYKLFDSQDLCELDAYSAILVDEWSKYPVDWVHNSGVKDIVLVKNLQVSGQTRAAMPDVGGWDMYYDATYSGGYAREVIHHEYDHLITYHYSSSFTPSDPTWESYNPAGFNYGNGGASCYVNLGSCPSTLHPVPGFVDFYATTSIAEDKAELYAYLMTDTYYHDLKSWSSTDSNLANKVTYYRQFIASYSPEMAGSYFDQINP